MKECSICKIEKDFKEFNKRLASKDNLTSNCKICHKWKYRTKIGLINRIYGNQRANSKSRKHPMPNYNKSELTSWILSCSNFELLYTVWCVSNYQKELTPSVDRIKDSKPYSLDNIQLMTWQENKDKGHKCIRDGILKHGNKPQKSVIQMDLNGDFIKEFASSHQAERDTGIAQQNIGKTCKGLRNHAGNFKWKYKNSIL